MEGKGTPKNEQNQFCHSPSVKAITPSEVERQDSHAAGVKYSLRDLSPSLMQSDSHRLYFPSREPGSPYLIKVGNSYQVRAGPGSRTRKVM